MIVNSSPLIILGSVNKLNLLNNVFDEVTISKGVYEEVVLRGKEVNSPDAYLVEEEVKKRNILVKELNDEYKRKAKLLERIYTQLHYGECETIALALQEGQKEVLIDEKSARQVARLHNITPRGTLRVLMLAFKKKIIHEEELKEIITKIVENKFRLSGEVINEFWKVIDEMKNEVV